MLAAQSCGCQDHSLELTKIVYTPPLSNVAEAVGPADRRLYSQEYIRTIDIEKGKVTRTLNHLQIPANAKQYVLVHLLKLPETPNDPFSRSQSTPDDQ